MLDANLTEQILGSAIEVHKHWRPKLFSSTTVGTNTGLVPQSRICANLSSVLPCLRGKFLGALIACLSVFALPAIAKDIEFEYELERPEMFIGESVKLTIKVSDFKEGMDPDLSGIKDCSIEFLGAGNQSFQNITIINGKRQITGFSGRNFSYSITPEKTGRISLGPITVTNNKSSKTIPGPAVMVRGIEKQDYVILSIDPSKENVIVDEPFTVTLRILIKALPSPYHDAPPLPLNTPSNLQIPYINNNEFEGLQGPKIEEILQAMVINDRKTPGFSINNFTFDSFFNTSLARFNLNPIQITVNGKKYFEYKFQLDYIPTTEGDYNFGPVTYKGQIYSGATSTGKGITKSIYAIAEKQTVQVIPPPAEGRPSSYIGAIGKNLSAKATLDSQTCKVGDPLTLSIAISGDIQFENIYAPVLNLQNNLKEDFRLYDDSVRNETTDGQRIYEYTVRPTQIGTLEFPPIQISFYNPDTHTYDTVSTSPIPIRANPSAEFKKSTVIDTADQSITIIADKNDPNLSVVAPISMQTINNHESIFSPKLHIPLLLLGPMLLLFTLAFKAFKKLVPAAALQQLQRTASTNFAQELQKVSNCTNPQHEIASALRKFISNRFDINAETLTPPELFTCLAKNHISEDVAKNFAEIFEQNFNASFQTNSLSDAEIKNAISDATGVVETIEAELQNSKKNYLKIPRLSSFTSVFILYLFITNIALSSPKQNGEYESQLAMMQLLKANSPAEFDSAAKSLEQVINSGVRNAPLFYNYGTALLMAEQPQAALNAFIRSERYSGTTWDLKRNMLIAISKLDENITTPTLPWYRTPLFWHYGLPARTRTTIASIAFLLIWIAFLMRKSRFKKNHHIVLGIAIATLIIFGSSSATSLYKELNPDRVIETKVQPQKGEIL